MSRTGSDAEPERALNPPHFTSSFFPQPLPQKQMAKENPNSPSSGFLEQLCVKQGPVQNFKSLFTPTKVSIEEEINPCLTRAAKSHCTMATRCAWAIHHVPCWQPLPWLAPALLAPDSGAFLGFFFFLCASLETKLLITAIYCHLAVGR